MLLTDSTILAQVECQTKLSLNYPPKTKLMHKTTRLRNIYWLLGISWLLSLKNGRDSKVMSHYLNTPL